MKSRDSKCNEQITDRIRHLLDAVLEKRGRPNRLHELTGIAPETWRQFFTGKQRATLTMLQLVSRHWPEYALWLAAGIDDQDFGHKRPVASSNEKVSVATSMLLKEKIQRSSQSFDTEETLVDARVVDELDISKTTKIPEYLDFQRYEFFQKIRWIEVFLDNFALEFDVDDAINVYNAMRGKLRTLELEVRSDDQRLVFDEVYQKFKSVKIEIEKRRDWIVSSYKEAK